MKDDMSVSNIHHDELQVPIPDTSADERTAEALRSIPDFDDNFTIQMLVSKMTTSSMT